MSDTNAPKAVHSPQPFRSASPLEGLSASERHRTWTRGAPDMAQSLEPLSPSTLNPKPEAPLATGEVKKQLARRRHVAFRLLLPLLLLPLLLLLLCCYYAPWHYALFTLFSRTISLLSFLTGSTSPATHGQRYTLSQKGTLQGVLETAGSFPTPRRQGEYLQRCRRRKVSRVTRGEGARSSQPLENICSFGFEALVFQV